MKCIVCEAPHRLKLVEVERPEPGPGEALVRVQRIGVCGTDLHVVQGDNPYFEYPRVLGHELAGEVAAVGENPEGLAVGDPVVVMPQLQCRTCVACRMGKPNCCANLNILGVQSDGGMREYMSVPTDHLLPAQGVDWDQIALVECLSIGARAARRAQVVPGELALVVGCGPIGLGTIQFAKLAGARVVAMDVHASRLEFCRAELGVEDVIDASQVDAHEAVLEVTGGENATLVYDATGNARAMETSFDFVSHGGRLVYVGLVKDRLSFSSPEFHRRELTVLSSRNATRDDFQHTLDCVRDGRVVSSCLVTHRASLEEAVEAFPSWLKPETGVIKAMIQP